jgi:hypothetical protein
MGDSLVEALRLLRDEMIEQRRVTRMLVEVLRELKDESSAVRYELHHLRTEREKSDRLRDLEVASGVAVAAGGG